MPQLTVACNEAGLRVGEDHQNAKLTNSEVDMIRELHGSGEYSYRRLAKMFEVSKSAICGIVKCKRRATPPAKFKTISVE